MSKCLNFRNYTYPLKEVGVADWEWRQAWRQEACVHVNLCLLKSTGPGLGVLPRPQFPRASFFSFRIGSRIKVFLLSPTYFKENWPLSTLSHLLLKRFNRNLKVMKTYSALEIYGSETQHILSENRHECFQG